MSTEVKDKPAGRVVLQNVRLSFSSLFQKVPNMSGKEGWKASFLIDPSTKEGKRNLKAIEDAVDRVKKEKWGDKASAIKLKEDRFALKNGDDQVSQTTGEVYDGYAGMMSLSTWIFNRRPSVLDRDKSAIAEEDGKIYNGCYVNASVTLYAVTGQEKGGNGVFATLEGVQFVKDGERFGGGGGDVSSDFEDLGFDEEDEGLV